MPRKSQKFTINDDTFSQCVFLLYESIFNRRSNAKTNFHWVRLHKKMPVNVQIFSENDFPKTAITSISLEAKEFNNCAQYYCQRQCKQNFVCLIITIQSSFLLRSTIFQFNKVRAKKYINFCASQTSHSVEDKHFA